MLLHQRFYFGLQLFFSFARAIPNYDYVIVGGGTAGLTVAARLTEDPSVSVLVLEAGNDHTDDLLVLVPGLFPAMLGDPEYDWNYQTIPQPSVNGRTFSQPRGKQLGGSSAINFMFWTHASRQDIDNWGALGNFGWSWNALQPYFKKSESYIAPNPQSKADLRGQYIDPSVHGKKGPIFNGFPDTYGPLTEAWPRTFETLGIAVEGDPRGGLAVGGYINQINVDIKTHTRSYAGNSYYLPAKSRPNLTVITGAFVDRIVLIRGTLGVKATGVLYSTTNATYIKVAARKEVILSAGSLSSPQILELSGIGNPKLLRKHGIKVIVSNSNVGENLQDHVYLPIGYEVVPGIATNDNFSNPLYFQAAFDQYLANNTGPLSSVGASSGLLSPSQLGFGNLRAPPPDPNLSSLTLAQYKLQAQHFGTEAVAQELNIGGGMSPSLSNDSTRLFSTTTPGNFLTLLGVLEHPFSRGSVHIASPDPRVYPTIDPRYISHPFDLVVLKKIALHVDNVLAKAAPLANLLKERGTVYQAGYGPLTESNVEGWIKKHLNNEYHPVGTVAMAPKSKGGVVDEKLRVYGVDGLRVVDASVFPMMVRANTQSLVYAVAERAAEWIKNDGRH